MKKIFIAIITFITFLFSFNSLEDNYTLPTSYQDNSIFSEYYDEAYTKLSELSLDEKIGQLFLVRYPSDAIEALQKYHLSGYIFFEKDFKNKTKDEVIKMIADLQNNTSIPLLTAVDEEGGKVVRISSNKNLADNKFKSPSELYELNGFEAIKDDTLEKIKLLSSLGINLNLAPVVDISTNESDYIYERTLKQDKNLTSIYAKTVIETSKNTKVSFTLKHFPGYSNNIDTHLNTSIDNRSYEEILNNDLVPFISGIEAKAEAIMISHNIVTSIDKNYPASLSYEVHKLLRNELNFTGIIMTDSLDMNATNSIEDVTVLAILAKNNLIITTDYEASINSVKKAINDGTITEEDIDELAFKVIAWKYYKGLM